MLRSITSSSSRRAFFPVAAAPRRGVVVCTSTTTRTVVNKKQSIKRFLSTTSSNHDLYMWGTDNKGSLLKPPDRRDETIMDVPQRILQPEQYFVNNSSESSSSKIKIRKVVCGAKDTAWLLEDGSCWVSGENKYGQLGQGHKNPVPTPVRLKLPPKSSSGGGTDESNNRKIVDISLGHMFTAVIDASGDLHTCGFGGSAFSGIGMLGHGNGESYLEPKLVTSLVEDGCTVAQVQMGEWHMTVLTTEGEVLTTGAGSYGRLGNFDTLDQLYLEPVELLSTNVDQIAGGKSFTLALQEGMIYGWGRNDKGQLGTGLGLAVDMYAMQAVPEPIQADELLGRQVTKIAAGCSHAACITKGGELFYWGMSLHLEPVRVNELLHTQVVDVVCGRDYTLALDQDGKLYSFGKGKTGCLGQGSTKEIHQATLMEAFGEDQKITQISAGWEHAACLVV